MQTLRPLKSHIRKSLFMVMLLAFLLVGIFNGYQHYVEEQQGVARILNAQIKIAKSLMPSLLLAHDSRYEQIARSSVGFSDEEILARISQKSQEHDPFDICYVLDKQGRIVHITKPYGNFMGFNPSHMAHVQQQRKVSRVYQSVFSKRAVVALKYRLSTNLIMVYERDVRNILPALEHLDQGKILPGQTHILLTSDGVVVYHPDQSLVQARHNMAFDMKDMLGPNARGLYSYRYNGISYFAVKAELITPRGWVLYQQVPAQPIFLATAKRVAGQLLEELLLFVILALVIQAVLTRFFSRPVEGVVASLAQPGHQAGEAILIPRDTGVLEFARIAEAINTMTADISQSQERFQRLVDSLDALVYVADMESYELLFVNKYGRDIWGDISGKICWQTLQTGQDGPCPFCTNQLLVADDGRPNPIHIWQFQNTVNNHWYECRDQAIPWRGDRLVRMEIAFDISARKQAEAALAAEKERLAVTLRSIGDGVITTDIQGQVMLLNAVAEKLTGWSQAEAVGRSLEEVFQIVHAVDRTPCENPAAKVIATGQIVELANHTLLIARDGREISIADSGAPIRDKDSEIVGVVLVFRDETEKLRLQEEFIKVKKLESVGVLAGGIAHDFNNILTAILGNVNLSLVDNTLADGTRQLLESAEKACLRAQGLTQQLLTFAKGGEPVKKSASIAGVITESANFVLHGSNVSCLFDIPDDLWLLEVDQGQMSQVVQNLVINAKDAMPEGGEIRVKCRNGPAGSMGNVPLLEQNRDYVVITISDNGSGISKDVAAKIFDPYFSTKAKGSGLGLSICHSIVTKHAGHISMVSRPGEGATFTIYLPASKQPSEKEKDREEAGGQSRAARIMVMDDEKMILDVARQMLEHAGHEVVLAHSGEEAVRLYEEAYGTEQAIDLVIMDLTIPGGMGGAEAVTKIRTLDPQAKAIVSSGYSNDPIMANFKKHGFVASLVKPFQIKSFFGVIEDVLAGGQ